MGLLDWFRRDSNRKLEELPDEPLTFDESERELSGLNVAAALAAHAEWNRKLQEVLDGEAPMPEIGDVARDDMCALGRWIKGEGAEKFGRLPAHASLRAAHADFHLLVGETLTAHAAGDLAKASECIRKVRNGSSRVQLELVRLSVAARGRT